MKSFIAENPLLTVMLQCPTAERVSELVRKSTDADAFGLQVEVLKPEYHNEKTYKKLFEEMAKPVYVTNYRTSNNDGKTDDELAEGIVTLAECGATLCDVMGDLYCRHPEELTEDKTAIEKQMKLIDTLHEKGAEVLMSSHLYKYAPAERVLEIAFEQKRRGADVIKIVTKADDMAQQMENLRITNLLKQELGASFLFLSGGECSLHRRLGIKLGCQMGLCVYEHDEFSTPAQPLLSTLKKVKEIDF